MLLQFGINRLLRLDKLTFQRLSDFAGKVIAVELTGLWPRFFILLTAQGVKMVARSDADANVLIRGTPSAMLTLLRQSSTSQALLASGQLELQGDIELAQQLQKLVQSYEVDWEEYLAKFLGDAGAHQVGSVVRRGQQWQQQIQANMMATASDYIREEARLLVTQTEMDHFFTTVDDAQDTLARIDARWQRLQQYLNTARLVHLD